MQNVNILTEEWLKYKKQFAGYGSIFYMCIFKYFIGVWLRTLVNPNCRLKNYVQYLQLFYAERSKKYHFIMVGLWWSIYFKSRITTINQGTNHWAELVKLNRELFSLSNSGIMCILQVYKFTCQKPLSAYLHTCSCSWTYNEFYLIIA